VEATPTGERSIAAAVQAWVMLHYALRTGCLAAVVVVAAKKQKLDLPVLPTKQPPLLERQACLQLLLA
jgi:hypothetical protein